MQKLTIAHEKLWLLHIGTDASEVDIFDARWDHNTFAGALKLFLRELPEPLLTYDLYGGFVSASSKLHNILFANSSEMV